MGQKKVLSKRKRAAGSSTPGGILILSSPLRRGDACPKCKTGRLDYNGLLELACERCGFVLPLGAGCS
jgi:uncharacterized protein (DUF983 family)